MDIKKFENFKSDLVGWVNVKIDNQIYNRMSRYVSAIDQLLPKRDKYNLAKKIDILSNVDSYLESKKVSLRDKISIISILQYLKEIRDERQFNPSSSGFLLEGFLAALVYGNVTNDYGIADITTSYNELIPLVYKADDPEDSSIRNLDFQIKLYKLGGDIKVNFTTLCDYYVICLKKQDSISVHILDGKRSKFGNKENTYYIGKFARKIRGTDQFMRGEEGGKQYIIIDTNKLERENKHKRELNVGDLDSLIAKCGENIQRSIKYVYDHLSDLHYDIDAILIGRDKNRKPIDVDTAANMANMTIDRISREVDNLKRNL
jgi:hypothetical protein